MGPIVVDASLTLSWCFADEATPYSRSVLATLESTYAVVPALWPVRGRERSHACRTPPTHHTDGHRSVHGHASTPSDSGRAPGGALAMAGGDPPCPRASAERLRCCLFGIGEA